VSDEYQQGDEDFGYDNALAETISGLYKAEVIHRRGPVSAGRVTPSDGICISPKKLALRLARPGYVV
jgi:hypothetical protein